MATQATDAITGSTVTLNLQDPDSMTLDRSGDLVLTGQADGELVVLRKPGQRSQSVLQIFAHLALLHTHGQ